MKKRNIRKGNIEIRWKEEEIVCYYKNSYYGREGEYKKEGDFYIDPSRPWHKIHESCFKSPEACYQIAKIIPSRDEEPDIKTVGGRPWRLEGEDWDNWNSLMKELFEVEEEKEEED